LKYSFEFALIVVFYLIFTVLIVQSRGSEWAEHIPSPADDLLCRALWALWWGLGTEIWHKFWWRIMWFPKFLILWGRVGREYSREEIEQNQGENQSLPSLIMLRSDFSV